MHDARVRAVLASLVVTFLWSSSFILIKWGLNDLNPLALVTYRYLLAAIVLCTMARRSHAPGSVDGRKLLVFLLLGITGYAVAQGLQVFGLYYLPAVTVSFILNFNPLIVLILGIAFLGERPTIRQGIGIAVTLVGVWLFFNDVGLVADNARGIAITLVSGIGWASYMVLSRRVLRGYRENIYTFTGVPMLIASLVLLATTGLSGNMEAPTMEGVVIIGWLAFVNTALAFYLWNHALQSVRAYEQCILQNTMLIQIAILSVIFLGETIDAPKAAGIACVFIGVLLVQLRNMKKMNKNKGEKGMLTRRAQH
jgi:drug/metabolite transporter (DMT)-like permease